LGAILAKLSKNKEAISIYKKLREVTGANTAVNRQLASLLIEAGDYDEALDILNELAKNASPDPIHKILLGRAQIGVHKYQEAIETLQSIVTPRIGLLWKRSFTWEELMRKTEITQKL